MNFWHTLPKPIVGLSAMDGVTDAALRQIVAHYGKPDLMMTEFTSADGIMRGVSRLLRDFYFENEQRPIVGQIFGSDPVMFRLCAIIVCELGFDGIDINMGCPAPSVASKGGGASLILTPKLAQELVRAVKAGVNDWVNGKGVDDLGLEVDFVQRVKQFAKRPTQERTPLPVSVKTRIGYSHPVVEEWIPTLLEVEPMAISIHGRTLEQRYAGYADWDEIAKAAEIIHQTHTLALGNGDILTPHDIQKRIEEAHVDGVLIGRATWGNPWFFEQWKHLKEHKKELAITPAMRYGAALEHAKYYEQLNTQAFAEDPRPFLNMRKHLGWYIKGFPNASELRMKLFQTNSSQEVQQILEEFIVGMPPIVE